MVASLKNQVFKIARNWKEHKFHQGMTVLFGLLFFGYILAPSSFAMIESEGTYELADQDLICKPAGGIMSGFTCQNEVANSDEGSSMKSPKYEITALGPSGEESDASISIKNVRDGDEISQSSLNVDSSIGLDNMRVEVKTVGANTVEGQIYSINRPRVHLGFLTAIFFIGMIGTLILATYTEFLEVSSRESNE